MFYISPLNTAFMSLHANYTEHLLSSLFIFHCIHKYSLFLLLFIMSLFMRILSSTCQVTYFLFDCHKSERRATSRARSLFRGSPLAHGTPPRERQTAIFTGNLFLWPGIACKPLFFLCSLCILSSFTIT